MTTNLNENASETQKILEQENEETNHAFIGFVNDLAETTDQTSKKSTELTDNNTQEKLVKTKDILGNDELHDIILPKIELDNKNKIRIMGEKIKELTKKVEELTKDNKEIKTKK